jgi:3-phenylpropionate/trans-cinnamate dioxygenase ferredoxin reductase subunit
VVSGCHFDVVIVGAGHAGVNVASYLTRASYSGSVALLSAERVLPYKRPPLSKGFLSDSETLEDIQLRSAEYWETSPVELVLGAEATHVDPGSRSLRVADGREFTYGELVWTTGGHARRLPVPGADLPGVHTLRSLDDTVALKAELVSARSAVIIGGGYIGLESAAAFRALGVHVTVVEAASRVLGRVTSMPVSTFFERTHREKGVDVILQAVVEGIRESDGRAHGVILGGGAVLPADIIVVGVGLEPNMGPLRDAGAACRSGIEVDHQGRTSLPHVFAAGDCTTQVNPFTGGRSMRLESVQNANDQAKAVVAALVGGSEPSVPVPWFWSDQYDVKMKTVGIRHDDDQVVVRGDDRGAAFSVLYLRQGRLVALDTINAARDFAHGRKLIEGGAHLDAVAAADPDTPLLKGRSEHDHHQFHGH